MSRTPRSSTRVSSTRVSGGRPSVVTLMPSVAELHLVARVGAERFGFPVAQVDEVIDAPRVSSVPGAPEGLLGQMRYRDRTVSAYDAGWAFGMRRVADGGAALVLRDGASRLAVVVDDAEDLQMVEPESVRAVPVGADAEGVLRGVCFAAGHGRRLMSLVRIDALVARATVREAPGSGSAR